MSEMSENIVPEMAEKTASQSEPQTPVQSESQTPVQSESQSESQTPENGEKTTPVLGRWWDALVVMILFTVAMVTGGVVCGFIAPLVGMELPNEVMRESVDPEVVEQVRFLQSRMVAVSYLVAMIVGLLLVRFYSQWRGWRESLSYRKVGWSFPFRLLCGYLLMWCVSITVDPLAEMLPGDQSSLGGGGWLLFSAVLLAPVFEETIFRGYIAGMLRRSYGGVAAWLVSSILFGVVHGAPSVAVSATCSGLVLGFYFLRYRSLVMVIMLHAMNNITACFLQTIEMDELSVREIISNDKVYWVVYGVSALVTLVALWRMTVAVSRLKSDNIEQKK